MLLVYFSSDGTRVFFISFIYLFFLIYFLHIADKIMNISKLKSMLTQNLEVC